MKNIIVILALGLFAFQANAQLKVISNGKVGIAGITNPQFECEVDGRLKVHGNELEVGSSVSTGAVAIKLGGGRATDGPANFDLVSDVSAFPNFGFRFNRATGGSTTMTHNGTAPFQIRALDAADILFLTNGNLVMNVDQSEQVGIGIGNPQSLLHVNGDIRHAGALISSDKRLKKDINKFDGGLAQVLKIQPYTYYYNGKGGIKSDELQYGVIAQEMQELLPEMVSSYEFQDFETTDEVHRAISTEEYLSVNTSAITYMLVNSIKEQQEIIEAKEERIADLETKFDELAALVSTLQKGGIAGTNVVNVDIHGSDLAVLEQNAPNPFNGQTTINYEIPTTSDKAQIVIYDENGRTVKSVQISHVGAGTLNVNAHDMPSGNYSYRLIVDGKQVATKKMVMAR